MFITNLDLIKQKLTANGVPLDEEIVADLIRADSASREKQNMAAGVRYYKGDHDILQHDFRKAYIYETDPETGLETEKLFENKNRSNIHTVNRFHTQLVDQKCGYVAGKEPSFDAGTDKKLRKVVSNATDEVFNDTLQNWIVGAANKGVEWLHFYKDPQGQLRYCITDARGIIPIYDTTYMNELQELIRYYTYTLIEGDKEYTLYKAEWWRKDSVTYYIQRTDERFVLDTSYACNPAPHWWDVTLVDGVEVKREPQSWGRVPFVALENNSEQSDDLQLVKGLIDAYDLISSAGTNDVVDLVALYWLVAGYGGETASAIAKKLQINRVVSVNDPNGSISAQQVKLSTDERVNWLKMLRRDVYRFGMGFDVDLESVGNATNVALNLQYGLLDLKADKLIPKLKRALKDFCWFIIEDHNRFHGTALDVFKVSVTINKTRITNEKEIVDMILSSRGLVPDRILLERHPFVDDADKAEKLLQQQKVENAKQMKKAFLDDDVPPDGDD